MSENDFQCRPTLLYKTVNGVSDNGPFLEQTNFNIRKGSLYTRHVSHYIPKNINVQELGIA